MNWTLLKDFWNEEEAQTTTEYILILLLVFVIIQKFKGEFIGFLEGLVTQLKVKAEDITNE